MRTKKTTRLLNRVSWAFDTCAARHRCRLSRLSL